MVRDSMSEANTGSGGSDGYVLPPPAEMEAPRAGGAGNGKGDSFLVAAEKEGLRIAGDVVVAEENYALGAGGAAPAAAPADGAQRKREARRRARAVAAARDRASRTLRFRGVPASAGLREAARFFGKCGIVMVDGESGRPDVVFYESSPSDGGENGSGGGEGGEGDGDGVEGRCGRVVYAMAGSVENAVLLLDGARFDGGDGRVWDEVVAVKRVEFDESRVRVGGGGGGVEDGERASAVRGGRVQKRRRAAAGGRDVVREALGWAEEGGAGGRMRMVVLKGMFNPAAEGGVDYATVRADVLEGCEECGAVERLVVFEGNAEGAVLVRFANGSGARACIEVMQGRWYDRRKVEAEYYDGVTDYRVKETEAQRDQREKSWAEWLGDEGEDSGDGEAVGGPDNARAEGEGHVASAVLQVANEDTIEEHGEPKS